MDERSWLKHYPQNVPSSLEYPDAPLQQLLINAAQQYPERVCLSLNNVKVTYQEMERLSDTVAGNLVGLGVKPGERVGLFLPNLPEFVIGFFGIIKAGGVAAAFNPQYKSAEFTTQARDAGAGLVISDATGYDMLRQVRQEAGISCLVITGDDVNLDPGDLPFSELRIGNIHPLPKIMPNDPVIYQYSGGTTGVPKGVIATHRNLLANALQFRAWLWNCWSGEETILAAIPLYHVYGMVLAMCLGLALSATLELVPNPRDLEAFQSAIQRSKPTIFPAVPGLLGLLANLAPDAIGVRELKSLKAVISGAAPLPDGIRKRFEKLTDVVISEGYGLSEAPTATHCNPIGHVGKVGTIGLPLPDVDARIISLDDEVTPQPVGVAGELVLRGPQIMQGYLNNPEETRLALRDGWLHTGDIAIMDEERRTAGLAARGRGCPAAAPGGCGCRCGRVAG
jgi:long-chain acyl-CoA synthetase